MSLINLVGIGLSTRMVAASEITERGVLSDDQCSFFHRQGYLSLSAIATEAEVAELRAVYQSLFDRKAGWEDGNFLDFAGLDDSRPRIPQILMPSLYEPSLKISKLHATCLHIARQLLGPSAEFVFDHAMTKPANGGPPTPWHQDTAFDTRVTTHETITFWMPLQAVKKEDGCLRFIAGSNNGPVLRHRRMYGDPRMHGLEALDVDEEKAAYCPLNAGDLTIHHHLTLHGAAANVGFANRWAYAIGFGVRTGTPTVHREFPWNRSVCTSREMRFKSTLGFWAKVRHDARSMLTWLRIL
jgi:hypothetical protein